MGPGKWGIGVRPALADLLLKSYGEAEAFVKENKLTKAAQSGQMASELSEGLKCSWLGSWLLFHGADKLSRAREWKQAEVLYQQALDRTPQGPPEMRAILLRGWAQAFRARNDWTNALRYEKQA
jgi:hypothetical protein